MIKKQMVLQSITGEYIIDKCERFANKRSHWLAELVVTNTNGNIIDTFEIKPIGKLYLSDLLDVISVKIDELVTDNPSDCGYRIFRLKGV